MSISRVVCQSQRIFARQFRSSVAALSGGGGGRPGGRPVLSWKERRTLEAREKESTDAAGDDSFEIADAGDFEELEKRFDLSSATMTDLSSLEVFSEPEELQESVRQQLAAEQQSEQAAAKGKRRQKGPRTFVVPSMLFGSHKSEGHMIPSRTAPVKVKFSHKRVFGDKKLSRDAASE